MRCLQGFSCLGKRYQGQRLTSPRHRFPMPGRLEELQELCSTLTARQRGASGVRKTYASEACTRTIGVAAQVSSAFAFVQTA
ncbi:unnamed protein product [Diplocarpon coronariae]